MSCVQERQVLESEAALVGQLSVLPQNVSVHRALLARVRLLNEHQRCESCIDRLFTLGPAPCPICNTVLRKLAFTPQTFEDLDVEKEVSIRKRLARE